MCEQDERLRRDIGVILHKLGAACLSVENLGAFLEVYSEKSHLDKVDRGSCVCNVYRG